jgi:hypothetical protein
MGWLNREPCNASDQVPDDRVIGFSLSFHVSCLPSCHEPLSTKFNDSTVLIVQRSAPITRICRNQEFLRNTQRELKVLSTHLSLFRTKWKETTAARQMKPCVLWESHRMSDKWRSFWRYWPIPAPVGHRFVDSPDKMEFFYF